uniref:Ligand dependent nuclear receptor corepressor-like n=1 Tax=Salarias fasciatus TaxID=181472 RepID=A0A672G6J9_SALFA
MATVQCIKCTAERRGFRRELDSWRHKLIHCIGMFLIVICFVFMCTFNISRLCCLLDCEPEEVDDWSPDGSCSQCSFCHLPLDKLNVPSSCDSNIPLIAQELMKKMIHQFALEYASECLLQTSANGVTRTSSPLSEASDAPLDLTVSRTHEGKESEPEPGRGERKTEFVLKAPKHENDVVNSGCDRQAVGSTVCHPQHRQSACSSHHSHCEDCKSDSLHNINYSCVPMCRLGKYTVGCSKRTHCVSCQSLTAGHNIMCSFAPSPSLCGPSSRVCPTSSVGKQSPSPPPLSPIPSDVNKKTDEKPPSLLHHQQDEQTESSTEISQARTSRQETDVDSAAGDESRCETPDSNQAETNQSGTLLQDVMNRFSEKLDTIRPLDKDPASASPGNLPFHADAHLTEIITTVLHTGRASDYNLSELFNRHDNGESKSPNTRSRRRQEVLAAIATPADDASTRRHTLQIKRELALLDQSCSKRRVPPAKKSRLKQGNATLVVPRPPSDPDEVKEISKEETNVSVSSVENDKVKEGLPNLLPTEINSNDLKEEIQTVIVTEEFQTPKFKGKEISSDENEFPFSHTQNPTPDLPCTFGKQDSKDESLDTQDNSGSITPTQRFRSPIKSQVEVSGAVQNKELVNSSSVHISETEKAGQDKEYHNQGKMRKQTQLNHSKEARRSRRNIVPPHRFSSYVTEPRKMFFVACFSEKIFNREAQKDSDLTPNVLPTLSKEPDKTDTQLVSRDEEHSSLPENPGKLPIEASQKHHGPTSRKRKNEVCVPPPTVDKVHTPEKDSSDNTNGSDCDMTPVRKLRSSPRRPRPPLTSSSPSDKDVSITSEACVENHSKSQIQYTSPIKLMFVSPVMDKEGIRYSLKSAGSGSDRQEEHFDPYEESSWSGTPQKHNSPPKEPTTPREKSVSSPLKTATSRTRSASLSPKSVSSPVKLASTSRSASSSPKSASSPFKFASSHRSATSPKIGSRRSGESTPTKRTTGNESKGSPSNLAYLHETTPPKRRPGRPKKLGPQLEQKVKRPIGRPRKEKAVHPVTEAKTNGKDLPASDEENVNKNLKITVMYGRSRRNKRTVSESFDQLQTEFSDACKAVGLKSDFGMLLHNSSANPDCVKASEELNFVSPAKELALQSCRNIKCQKRDESAPSRKPGRPAKVKISGISVTVTTVSPRQRKIQINKDPLQPSETTIHKKSLLPHFKSAKEPRTISSHLPSKITPSEEVIETRNENKDELSKKPVAVRHSMRVRKPSVHFLRAVATSSFKSYSRSNALLRRSKQLLLSKASNERRQEGLQRSVETSREDNQLSRQEEKSCSQDISKVAGVSVAPIFTSKETKWWTPSAEQKTMNQELARRIRVISDTWVSDSVENKETPLNPKLGSKGVGSVTRKTKQSSVVRTLFDCSPNKPRSCSMQQICSWFMQTTETRSLSIVKKASSRNLYDPVQFSRSANKTSVCNSPQAERLWRHIKKFAKVVPKTPSQHHEAQRRLRKSIKARLSTRNVEGRLFTSKFSKGKVNQGIQVWKGKDSGSFQATLIRARTRFLTKKDRLGWQEMQKKKNKAAFSSLEHRATTRQPKRKALQSSEKDDSNSLESRSAVNSADQTQEPVDVCKELNLCSKAWSPETLKECRVFLRKINSPDTESTEEEWDSCTVTLDNGSHSAYLFAGRGKELVRVVKAVKTERKKRANQKAASTELVGSTPKSVLKQDETSLKRQRGRRKSPEVVSSEPSQSPPAKMLRQSRVRGLTGPKWSDFVFGNLFALF